MVLTRAVLVLLEREREREREIEREREREREGERSLNKHLVYVLDRVQINFTTNIIISMVLLP